MQSFVLNCLCKNFKTFRVFVLLVTIYAIVTDLCNVVQLLCVRDKRKLFI